VLDAGVGLVGVPACVLGGVVRCDPCWDLLGDEALDTVVIGPGDIAELVGEGRKDDREPVEIGLR
jgi:hypothetical protein